MSVQIWEKAAEDIGDLEQQIERGEFAALREWLGEHVHAHGSKFTPQETLRRATGSTIDAKPYLAYLKKQVRRAGPRLAVVGVAWRRLGRNEWVQAATVGIDDVDAGRVRCEHEMLAVW